MKKHKLLDRFVRGCRKIGETYNRIQEWGDNNSEKVALGLLGVMAAVGTVGTVKSCKAGKPTPIFAREPAAVEQTVDTTVTEPELGK